MQLGSIQSCLRSLILPSKARTQLAEELFVLEAYTNLRQSEDNSCGRNTSF